MLRLVLQYTGRPAPIPSATCAGTQPPRGGPRRTGARVPALARVPDAVTTEPPAERR